MIEISAISLAHPSLWKSSSITSVLHYTTRSVIQSIKNCKIERNALSRKLTRLASLKIKFKITGISFVVLWKHQSRLMLYIHYFLFDANNVLPQCRDNFRLKLHLHWLEYTRTPFYLTFVFGNGFYYWVYKWVCVAEGNDSANNPGIFEIHG
jgi:hypothetical protein